MKKHIALIIDTDADYARKFSALIEPNFMKVYAQTEPEQYERDLKGLKPDVVFLNLNLKERETGFGFLEKTLPSVAKKPLAFAYLDAADPEFVAHAIENGIEDVFTKPFDPYIITSKVNKLLSGENKLDQHYFYLSTPLKALVEFNFKVISVDENGITLQGNHFISKGTTINLGSTLTKEIFGTESIQLMVTKTWMGDNFNDYLFFLEPRTPNETTSASLRRYILSKI